MFSRVKGTQDFLDLTNFNYVIDQVSQHLHLFNFKPIATPILETADLFVRSLGEDTDVVHKEMFFVSGKVQDGTPGNEQLVLRPEMTASIMRAFLEQQHELTARPWRAYTWGPAFRYERPQKGRYRQFHQISIELIDAASVTYDAEFIAMLYLLFSKKLGLSSCTLELNYLGTLEDRDRYKRALIAFLDSQNGLPAMLLERKEKNILRCFDLKDDASRAIMEQAPILLDYLCEESLREWQLLQRLLHDLAVPFVVNPRLVRGLDYYNKTVFEFTSTALGSQSALCGGGRYDSLAKQFGCKESLPAIGVGIGVERILLIMEATGCLPRREPLSIIFVPLSRAQEEFTLLCAQQLRSSGVACETLFDLTSVKSMMRKADKHASLYAYIIGDDELAGQYITAKNMATGQVFTVAQSDLISFSKAITA